MKSVLSLVSLIALTGTLAGALALGDDGKKETAAALSAEETIGSLDPSAFGMFEGRWEGMVNGNYVEEHWSAVRGPSIIGMFRWCNSAKGEAPLVFELLSITKEADGVSLRVKHFSSALEAWKSEPAPPRLFYNEKESARTVALFEDKGGSGLGLKSCRYESDGETLTIVVSFAEKKDEAPREALKFELKKVK
ncbi:MAG TPA: DUF6265 family protein [Phycisphaerales bacterium]|nr:DUF6265 family protein [Phycisphaerales bacterium]